MQRTLVFIKPDGVKRGLIGEIIARFERIGLRVVGAKMLVVNDELLRKHYDKDVAWYKKIGQGALEFWKKYGKDPAENLGTSNPVRIGKMVQKWLFEYIQSGPVLAVVLQGPHAVELVRKHVGPTYPLEAPPGTIRGDYYYDSPALANFDKRAVYNMIHASGSVEEAEFEIKLWFRVDEIFEA